ncbi:hypothetical protein ACFLXH_05960 [Chloroflexota bacterium]
MKKFMVFYSATGEGWWGKENATQEDMEKSMEAWMEWGKKCGSSLVDFGSPLAGGHKLTKSGSSPSDINILGYSILEAKDMDGAKALLEGHPHLRWSDGAAIDVFESAPM